MYSAKKNQTNLKNRFLNMGYRIMCAKLKPNHSDISIFASTHHDDH